MMSTLFNKKIIEAQRELNLEHIDTQKLKSLITQKALTTKRVVH